MNLIQEWISKRDCDSVTIYPNGDIRNGCTLTNPELVADTPIEGHSTYVERHRFFSRMPLNVATSQFLHVLGPVTFRKMSTVTAPSTTAPSIYSHKMYPMSTSPPIPIPTKIPVTSKLFERDDRHEFFISQH
jgi:hypothetical protein